MKYNELKENFWKWLGRLADIAGIAGCLSLIVPIVVALIVAIAGAQKLRAILLSSIELPGIALIFLGLAAIFSTYYLVAHVRRKNYATLKKYKALYKKLTFYFTIDPNTHSIEVNSCVCQKCGGVINNLETKYEEVRITYHSNGNFTKIPNGKAKNYIVCENGHEICVTKHRSIEQFIQEMIISFKNAYNQRQFEKMQIEQTF